MVVVDAALRERMVEAARAAWHDQRYFGFVVDAVLALVPEAAVPTITIEPASPGEPDYPSMGGPEMLEVCGANGMKWAEAFCQMMSVLAAKGPLSVDRGWMVGWFANAIERAEQVRHPAPPAPDPRLAAVAAWRDYWHASPGPDAPADESWRADEGVAALHSLLSELLTRVTALERGR